MKRVDLFGRKSAVVASTGEGLHAMGVPSEDVHIAGILVHAHSAQLEEVRLAIAALAGTVVHGAHADGRLVVTTEGASSRALLDAMNSMSAIPGVISAALVYQHNESLHAMQQEMA